jgi:cysteine desulfurase
MKKTKRNNTIYLDNSGTTPMDDKVIEEMTYWCKNAQNPSSSSKLAKESKEVLEKAQNKMLEYCYATKLYTVLFTSCATESNSFILLSTVDAYWREKRVIPTVVVSAIEHSSVIECTTALERNGRANICYIMPNIDGVIPIASVEMAIKSHSHIAIISIMFANNELGAINNVKEIGALAHSFKIPLHVDAVQMFGKYRINLHASNIDALSASFHKFNGPRGLGLLYIKNELITGYKLEAQIFGTQQFGLRAGTENIPAIACSIVALDRTAQDRERKNEHLWKMRDELINGLKNLYPIGDYSSYVQTNRKNYIDGNIKEFDTSYEPGVHGDMELNEDIVEVREPVELVFLGPSNKSSILPHILSVAVVKNVEDSLGNFCNIKLKDALDENNIVVSIGSACNTDKKEASHVLRAIRAPPIIKRGVIRISLGDHNTMLDIKTFLSAFDECVKMQIENTNLGKKSHTKSKQKKPATSENTSKKVTTHNTKQNIEIKPANKVSKTAKKTETHKHSTSKK